MEFRSARPSERDEVLDLLAQWYHDRDFFARYANYDPAFRDDLCLIARDRGRLISTVQIFDRTINLAGAPVRMGGIGSVFTDPAFRGRGLASALLQMSLQRMADGGFETSLLFTDRTDYYARFGWEAAERQFTPLLSMARADVPGGYDIDLFAADRDLPEVMEIYRTYSGAFDFTVLRDEAYWRGNLRYAGNPDEYFVVARRNGILLAYARAIRLYDYPIISEHGYLPGARDALLPLLKHMGEIADGAATSSGPPATTSAARALAPSNATQAVGLLVTHSVQDPDLEQRLAQANVSMMHHTDRLFMWRAINAKALAPRLGVTPDQAQRRLLELASSSHALYWTSDRF